MKKIRAYTIMELLVVMLIGMIVITIAYKTFFIFKTQIQYFQKGNDEVKSTALLNLLLTRDFSRAEVILSTPSGIKCKLPEKTVEYYLNEKFIIRTDLAAIDTFNLSTVFHTMRFQGVPIQEQGRLLDDLRFESNEELNKKYFVFKKMYGADALVQVQLTTPLY